MNKEDFTNNILKFKTWLMGLGIGGLAIALWWIVKIIICLTMGICIL
jgi:hypothetical protein